MKKIIQKKTTHKPQIQENVEHESTTSLRNYNLKALIKNDTWHSVDLPEHKTNKHNKIGTTSHYKACLVVSGFKQKQERDYERIFNTFAKFTSIRMILRICASLNY